MGARIVSVNVAQPRVVMYKGREVTTSIRKKPISGRRVALGEDGLCGDAQADRARHGGAHKAAYAYASEHYEYWRSRHRLRAESYGLFGENLTTEGLSDNDVCIGDDIAIGDAILRVTQPRIPCYKLNIATNRERFDRVFGHSARLGFYMKVMKTGFVQNGDAIEIASRDALQISSQAIAEMCFLDTENYSGMTYAMRHKELPPDIAKVFQHRLARSGRLFG